MSQGVGGTSADGVSVAVAFFQAPGRFPDLLHGRSRLPPGVGTLLHLATGGATPGDDALPPFVSAADLQQAALFFIEQVLLAHNADHYRVLGVNPEAPLDEIKEHHRLLMRLFHPDRQAVPEERKDAFATRINQAYSTLRAPASRAAYDASLRQPKAASGPVLHTGPGRYTRPETESFLHRFPPVVARNFPQLVLGGVALVAALAVAMVYVDRVPPGAIGAGDGMVSRAPPPAPTALANTEPAAGVPMAPIVPSGNALQESAIQVAAPVAAVAAAGSAAPQVALPSAPARVSVTASAAEIRRIDGAGWVSLRVVPAAGDRHPSPAAAPLARPGPPPATSPSATEAPPPAAMPVVTQKASPVPVPVPAPPTEPDAAVPQALRPEQLGGLLERLSGLYERGDLEGLMSLFDEGARIEHGGKGRIRSDYSDLFRSTEARQLHVWDVTWSRHGEVVRGEGSFEARVIRKGESAARVYNGSIRIEIMKRNDAPLIVGLFHTAS